MICECKLEIHKFKWNNYDLGLVKADNGSNIYIFNIIDAKDMKYKKQK